jgi:hypothetical protein
MMHIFNITDNSMRMREYRVCFVTEGKTFRKLLIQRGDCEYPDCERPILVHAGSLAAPLERQQQQQEQQQAAGANGEKDRRSPHDSRVFKAKPVKRRLVTDIGSTPVCANVGDSIHA